MELDAIIGELRSFIRERFKVAENDPDFNDDVHLFDYGYVDSFGAVELIAFVREKYSVEITASDLVAFPLNTVREIATFAVKRLNGEI
jgi:D-alanine--poly(phosphoribitol) ligase subunit 2